MDLEKIHIFQKKRFSAKLRKMVKSKILQAKKAAKGESSTPLLPIYPVYMTILKFKMFCLTCSKQNFKELQQETIQYRTESTNQSSLPAWAKH
jgi:hypothetical protein